MWDLEEIHLFSGGTQSQQKTNEEIFFKKEKAVILKYCHGQILKHVEKEIGSW